MVGISRAKSQEDQFLLEQILSNSPNSKILYIHDSRPKVNAQVNTLMGMGYESTSIYQNCSLEFYNIPNIHIVRDSMEKLGKAIKCKNFEERNILIENSGWLEYIRKVKNHISI